MWCPYHHHHIPSNSPCNSHSVYILTHALYSHSVTVIYHHPITITIFPIMRPVILVLYIFPNIRPVFSLCYCNMWSLCHKFKLKTDLFKHKKSPIPTKKRHIHVFLLCHYNMWLLCHHTMLSLCHGSMWSQSAWAILIMEMHDSFTTVSQDSWLIHYYAPCHNPFADMHGFFVDISGTFYRGLWYDHSQLQSYGY